MSELIKKNFLLKRKQIGRFTFILLLLFLLTAAAGTIRRTHQWTFYPRSNGAPDYLLALNGSVSAADDVETQQLLAEAIRSAQPEKLSEMLKKTKPVLPRDRELFMRGFASYRSGDFESAESLVLRMNRESAEAALLQSLLLGSRGLFEESEKHARSAFERRAQLGPFFFEAGLQLSYVLQHLKRHRDAAPVIEAITPDAPIGRPVLRCIAASLNAAPSQPYEKQPTGDSALIPLLSDGSIPPRTMMRLQAGQEPAFVLFDTGTSLTFLKVDRPEDSSCAMAMALDPTSNVSFQYGWVPHLELANWKIQNVPVGLVRRQSAGMHYQALFGLPLMQQFFVVFDFPARSMRLLASPPTTVEGHPVLFRYVADQLIIPARINNRRANILLDTGLALPSLKLDISWSDKLADPIRKKAGTRQAPASKGPKLMPKTGAVELTVKSLKFGNQELKDLPISFESLQRRLQQTPLATRIDAILSAPLVKQYVISIDFEKNRIYFK